MAGLLGHLSADDREYIESVGGVEEYIKLMIAEQKRRDENEKRNAKVRRKDVHRKRPVHRIGK
jgi:hypothetical protein